MSQVKLRKKQGKETTMLVKDNSSNNQQKPQKKNSLRGMVEIDDYVTIQAKNGIQYRGRYKAFTNGYYYLRRASIVLRNPEEEIIEQKWILVERSTVQHIVSYKSEVQYPD